jgi:hypothetical protein
MYIKKYYYFNHSLYINIILILLKYNNKTFIEYIYLILLFYTIAFIYIEFHNENYKKKKRNSNNLKL